MKKILIGVVLLSLILVSASCSKNVPEKQAIKNTKEYAYPAYVDENNVRKWGFINKDGKFIAKPSYEGIGDFDENGLAKVWIKKKPKDAGEITQNTTLSEVNGEEFINSYGFVNEYGEVVAEPKYTYVEDFHEGVCIATIRDNSFEVIDLTGKVLFKSENQTYRCSDGVMAFCKTNKDQEYLTGYRNKEGKVIIEPAYKRAFDFVNGKTVVTTSDDKQIVINKTGKKLLEINSNYEVTDFSEDIMVFRDKNTNKMGYMSLDGKVMIDARFSSACKFENGFAVADSDENNLNAKTGLINKKGEFVIKPEFIQIDSLGENFYAACKVATGPSYASTNYNKKAIFNSEGKQVSDFKFYEIGDFKDGVTNVNDDASSYFIDKSGVQDNTLPVISGISSIGFVGDLIQIKENNLIMNDSNYTKISYVAKSGVSVWKPADKKISLAGGVSVREAEYKPNRCALVFYPEILDLPDKNMQESLNKDLKKIFTDTDSYRVISNDGLYEASFTKTFDIKQIKDLLVVNSTGYYYPFGAAHGMPSFDYYHVDTKTGKFYKMDNLFKKGVDFKKVLYGILERQFKERKKDPNSGFSVDAIPKKEQYNFIIKKDALQIYFEPYEIASYAAGLQEFDIPYAEIKNIIDVYGDFYKSFEGDLSVKGEG